jgi:hypothetical protein
VRGSIGDWAVLTLIAPFFFLFCVLKHMFLMSSWSEIASFKAFNLKDCRREDASLLECTNTTFIWKINVWLNAITVMLTVVKLKHLEKFLWESWESSQHVSKINLKKTCNLVYREIRSNIAGIFTYLQIFL